MLASARLLLGRAQRRGVFTKRCLERQPALPHHSLKELRHGDLLFASEPSNPQNALDQAVRAVGHATMDWLARRGVEVAREDMAEHVAMVVADSTGHATAAVEAVRVAGVHSLPLPEWFKEFVPGTRFFHGQLKGVSREQARAAVAYAMQRMGAPFAADLAPPDPLTTTPWDQAFYGSSLVDFAYREALGQELVFTDEPFPLIFEPEAFWQEYFRNLGQPQPKGFGSNPTLLLHSAKVQYSMLFRDADKGHESVHELF